jgi:hypothetical protein
MFVAWIGYKTHVGFQGESMKKSVHMEGLNLGEKIILI